MFENILSTLNQNKKLVLIAAAVLIGIFFLTRKGTAQAISPTMVSNP